MMDNDLISRSALLDRLAFKLKGSVQRETYSGLESAISQVKKAPAVDAVKVVRCKDCVTHGNCLTEDTFNIARIENPFCCGGKRRADDAID